MRPLRVGDLDRFLDAGAPAGDRTVVRRYVQRMFAEGSMRPEWCFVVGDLGRVALWTLPGMDQPLALVLLDVGWDADDSGRVGGRLLEAVLERARHLGARELEHVVDDPPMEPQFQHYPAERVTLLEAWGFGLRRETHRWEWRGEARPSPVGRLRYRELGEIGEEAFVEAMMRASEGTLDREIQDERARLGPYGAARDFFDAARRVAHDPRWWRLAYDADDALVGLVMPAQPPGFLTLFYVAVVPEMRGRGYVDDLLAAGTRTLLDARSDAARPLRADTDVANGPMAAAFERAGWTRFARRREYVRALDSTRA